MVRSFDDLIGFLLDEIALCGEEGMLAAFATFCAPLHRSQPTLRNPRHPCPNFSTVFCGELTSGVPSRLCKSLHTMNIAPIMQFRLH